MKLALALAAVVTLASRGGVARADEPLYTCHAVSPTTKLRADFRPGVSIYDLTLWVVGFSCKNVVFTPEVAQHAMRLDVIAPNEMTSKQAVQLYVDAIEATGLVVTQKNDTILIKLGPDMPRTCPDLAASAPTPTPAPATAADPPAPSDAELAAGIHRIDDHHVTMTRALVDGILANPAGTSTGVRVVPAMANGQPDGVKLYAIRPSSLFGRLGFHNGDTVHVINGFALSSAEAALDIYVKLRDASAIEVDLTREGKPFQLFIAIQ